MVQWFSTAFKTISKWVVEQGWKNLGWAAAFVFCWFFGSPLLVRVGFVFLGIFIEKNRKKFVEIWREIRAKEIFNKIRG